MPTTYEAWVARSDGVRLACLDDFDSIDYVLGANTDTELEIILRGDYPQTFLAIDNRIEVWRFIDNLPGYLDGEKVWLIRYVEERWRGAEHVLTLAAVSSTEILATREILYDAESAYAAKTDNADDMMKAIVREAFTSSALVADRDGYSASDSTPNISAYLTVQADLAQGVSTTMGFSRKNVLETLQEIARKSAEDGTAIYFDIVAIPSVNAAGLAGTTLEFRTYKTLRGIDHTFPSGLAPLTLSMEFGNLDDVTLARDHRGEVTFVSAAGTGLNADRQITFDSDTTRMGISPFNRRERVIQAFSAQEDSNARQAIATAELRAGRPLRIFAARLVETEQTRYGVHWRWGDKVTAIVGTQQFDCKIDVVRVSVADGVENIQADLRIEDS